MQGKAHSRRLCASGQLDCDARIIFRVGERTCGGPHTIRAVSCGLSSNRVSEAMSTQLFDPESLVGTFTGEFEILATPSWHQDPGEWRALARSPGGALVLIAFQIRVTGHSVRLAQQQKGDGT